MSFLATLVLLGIAPVGSLGSNVQQRASTVAAPATQVAVPPTQVAVPPTQVAVLRRILVLGASLSHGFGLERDVGARVELADVLEATLRAPHDPIRPKTSLMFFVDPLPTGQGEIAAGKALDPTLVVGLDFLFWFGYGEFASESDRLAMLDKGTTLLETFPCPVLVGDFPDVSDAARSPGGKDSSHPARGGLLSPEQVPDPSTLKKLNERLRSWASAHENIIVVPLADLVARLHSGKELEIHGNRWPADALTGFIQKDRLHPTLQGTIALVLGALDGLVAGKTDVPASAFEWDAKVIWKRVYDSREKERARQEGRSKSAPSSGGSDRESGAKGEKSGGG